LTNELTRLDPDRNAAVASSVSATLHQPPPPLEWLDETGRTAEPSSASADQSLPLLLRLREPQHPGNLASFQRQWRRGLPVVVSGCDRFVNSSLWHPRTFSRQFGSCRANVILPDRYEDFQRALPLPEYSRRDGRLNLATRLPAFFVQPDLGPKMYNAYGMARCDATGTTNLHLDIADAVNLLVYVGVPEDAVEQQKAAVYAALERAKVDPQVLRSVTVDRRVPGALWQIFSPSDAPAIRRFLHRVLTERGERLDPDSDPIHDQLAYLSSSLLEQLREEHGVRPFTIVQFLGDAIFIPAGAPHQVRNLHSCIKVATDFVSPENIKQCLQLTREFRQLSSAHSNHEDKLQVKNMIYHSVKDCVAILSH
uniref:JmjC domain-containing protein n=1 Tax=Macrostomum lignano TaxID=282301 RepID=A0A1I8HL36_9PLAT